MNIKIKQLETIENASKRWESGDSICLGLEWKSNQKLIGTVRLFSFHKQSKRAEIGYVLCRFYWGSGIMTEALNEFIHYAFSELKLNRLEADIDPDNKASAQLLVKLGFNLEGRLKQRWIVNGVVSDSEIYGLIRSEYNDQRGH